MTDRPVTKFCFKKNNVLIAEAEEVGGIGQPLGGGLTAPLPPGPTAGDQAEVGGPPQPMCPRLQLATQVPCNIFS
jgi:hypothetical protein